MGGNILDNIFNSSGNSNNTNEQNTIPQEILNQYPYGQFPLRYTKMGQEIIRKQSESRFENSNNISTQAKNNSSNENFNLSTLIPIVQMLSTGKKNSKDMMQIFSKLLFKDNPDLQKLISLIPNLKGQELKIEHSFPNTNKVQISSLKKID